MASYNNQLIEIMQGLGISTDLPDNLITTKLDAIIDGIGVLINSNSPAIVETATGTSIVLNDSANRKIKSLEIYGQSTQNGTGTIDQPVDVVSVGDDGTLNITFANGMDSTLEGYESQSISIVLDEPLRSIGNYRDVIAIQNNVLGITRNIVAVPAVFSSLNIDGQGQSFALLDIDEGIGHAIDYRAVNDYFNSMLFSQTGNCYTVASINKAVACVESGRFAEVSELNDITEDSLLLFVSSTHTFFPFDKEIQEKWQSLKTYYPNTYISNSESASMKVEYVADTKKYIDSE